MEEGPDREATDVVGARVGAQVLDLFVSFLGFFLLAFLFGVIGAAAGSAGGSDAIASLFTGIGIMTAIGILLGYSFILEALWNGQTIGKRLVGIKAVKEDGSEIDTASAFVRNIPAVVSLSWVAYLVALLSMASSDKRQRLFDRAAGTVVVRENWNR